jgi:hypothetical protein
MPSCAAGERGGPPRQLHQRVRHDRPRVEDHGAAAGKRRLQTVMYNFYLDLFTLVKPNGNAAGKPLTHIPTHPTNHPP